jgi:hypothetical protein
MQKKPFVKLLSLYLVVAVVLLTLPSQGWAMFLPSEEAASVRKADMTTIQKTLESAVVKQRLMDYGLSSEEAMARVNTLSDQQIHRFAADLNSLQAGADGVDALIFLVLVAILVVVILEVTGHHVIVR